MAESNNGCVHLILVSSNAEIRELVSGWLSESNYSFRVAASCAEGERLFQEQCPDILLLDLSSPDNSRLDVCRRMKSKSDSEGVFAVIIAQRGNDANIRNSGSFVNADDYIWLPCSKHEFLSKLEFFSRVQLVEQAFRRNEELYREFIENTWDIILKTDAQGRLLFFNNYARHLFEIPIDSYENSNVLDYLHKSDRGYAKRYVEDCFRQKRAHVSFDSRVVNRNGDPRHVSWKIRVHYDEVGNPEYLNGIGRDVTSYKLMEATLRRQKKELETRNRIAQIFLTVEGSGIYSKTVDVISHAMNSKLGFFGYLDEEGFLVHFSTSGDSDVRLMGDVFDRLPPERWGGIWEKSISERMTVIANEELSLSEYHVRLERAISVPVINGHKVIGVIVVGDKESDYSKVDKEFLESIASSIAPMLDARLKKEKEERIRLRTQRELERAYDNLEEKVKSRTLELQATVKSLNSQIKERKLAEEEVRRNYQTQSVINLLLNLSIRDDALGVLLHEAASLLASDHWLNVAKRVCVMLLSEDGESMYLVADSGVSLPLLKGSEYRLTQECQCGIATESGEVRIFKESESDCHVACKRQKGDALFCMPIRMASKVLGILNVSFAMGSVREESYKKYFAVVSNELANMIVRKNTESALRSSQKRYLQLHESSMDGIVSCNLKGNILDCNSAFLSMIGYDHEEMKLLTDEDLTPPKYRDWEERVRNEKVLVDGNSGLYEKEIIRKDGSVFSVEQTSYCIYDSSGEPCGFWSLVRDISQRKQYESRIRESEQKYRNVVEYAREGILVIQGDMVRFHNRTALEIMEYGEREMMMIPILSHIHEANREYVSDLLENLIAGRSKSESFNCRAVSRSGKLKWLEINCVVVEWRNFPAILAFFSDVSMRIKAEQDKQALQAQLQHTQKLESIGTLAGGIAHDFNNLLAVIIGNGQMLMEDVSFPDEESRMDLQLLLESAERAKDLVHQILVFSRQDDAEKQPFEIVPVIKETIKLLRSTLPSTIEIESRVPSEFIQINSNPAQIKQVLMNLCTNAAQAMSPNGGKLVISIDKVFIDENKAAELGGIDEGGYCRLKVVDNGYGIPSEIADRIFDPFFTTQKPGGGSGMGLSVVHGIVVGHKGTIDVQSKEAEGTSVHIYFPIFGKSIIGEASIEDAEIGKGKERIMVIDDEESVARSMKRVLSRQGYQVSIYNRGQSAFEAFQNDPDYFDLVITDQTMPGMRGSDLAKKLQRIGRKLPIILTTGYGDLDFQSICEEAGIGRVVNKPISRKELCLVVREQLDNYKQGK